MSREKIQELFDRRRDAVNRHDSATLAMLFDPACLVESPAAGGTVSGRAAVERVHQAWFTAFPDFVYSDHELLIDGDRVAEVATMSGADTGGFMGLPATGKPFRVPVITLSTVKDGLIVHERRIYDFTGLLVQIGVLKAKPA
jgi:steroid delta-isomerase-like uncharacterized protein